ncbi:MAG TPA: hypothetical protein VHC69_33875 [Polyangiaceae bacterium]|nr:hypothetical protein [Polyangiaceae bacterium]HVW30411.1 hypothetical protein [Polyangiaceae bacterium]
MTRRAPTLLLALAGVLASACEPAPEAAQTAPPKLATPNVAAVLSTATPPPSATAGANAAPALEPTTIVADPDVLSRLSESGFDAGTLLVGARGASTAELAKHPEFRTLRDAVAADLAADRRADPQAGVGMRFAHRQFDARWLDSEKMRFVLIGVVNRLDRKVFAPEHCGEVRFVYRLAYTTTTAAGVVESRLPMTMNVVSFMGPPGPLSCRDTARAWLRPASMNEPAAQAAWLVGASGPLSPERRAAFVPKSVELNFQSVRWPSTVRPAMAGHAEYVQRVFHRIEAAPYFVPAALENTIDARRLVKDAALTRDLVSFLSAPETLRAIDEGTVLVPERFLATRAVSVTPHGLARRANRPYATVLETAKLGELPLSRYETIASPASLSRRLDELSCPGCHQSRSIAGFHLLGVEPASDRVDALEVPMSPHLHADLERRRAYVISVASGAVPDERRPPAERGAHDDGAGARCGLGDPGFSKWTCAADLACVRETDSEIGVCTKTAGPTVGDACEAGAITRNADAHADRMTLRAPVACEGGRVCEANGVGFPDGMCAGGCDALPDGAACGGIPLLTEFNTCLAAGTSFERCIAENTRPGALHACSFHVPCRDDYVCARAASGGVCMPPYFLFQLRVDGHPL